MCYLKAEKGGDTTVSIHVQPKSSRNRVAGLHGDRLKICITAPPVDGKANTAVVNFMAKLFNVPKSSVSIKSGHQSRSKVLLIRGVPTDSIKGIIEQHISSP